MLAGEEQQSAIVVEKMPSVRKVKVSVAKQTDRRQETRDLLDQIKVRGDQSSARRDLDDLSDRSAAAAETLDHAARCQGVDLVCR